MRICIVGTEIGPSKEGAFVRGHTNNIARLTREFSKAGHTVYIVTNIPDFSRLAYYEKWMNWAKVYPFETINSYPSRLWGIEFLIKTLREIAALHRKESLDIVNVHSGYADLAILTYFIRKILRIPSAHTLYCPVDTSYLSRFGVYGLFSGLSFSLDRVIAVSANVKTSLEKVNIPSFKIEIIPPSIDTSIFNPSISGVQIRRKLEIDEEDQVVLFIGNLDRNKGIDFLIDAIPIVKTEVKECHFLVVLNDLLDRNTRKRSLQLNSKIAKYKLGQCVHIIGITGNISQIIAACDIFVAPFVNTKGPADYPVSLLEAMAMRKAVIATNVGGIPELVNNYENGILVHPHDPVSLAESIIYLIKHKDTRDFLGDNASSLVMSKFSAQEIAKKTIRIYTQMLESPSAS